MAQTGYTPLLIYSSSTVSQAPAAGNLTNSTLGSELAINITDGKLFYKDNANAVQVIAWKTTPTTAGGTGLTSYTAGDMLYYATGTTLTKLAIGASGCWLGSSGTAPQWNAPAALTKTDDTNVTLTLGGSASTALLNAASLTLGWTGQLATTRGGTGLSSFTANGILYASSTSALATGSALTFDGTNFATTGTATATKFIPTGGAITGNGMYLPATNAVAITTNGAQAIYMDSSQRVGMGTTAPSSGLEIVKAYSVDTDGAANKWTARFKDSTAYAAGVGGSILLTGIKSSGGATGNFAGIAGLKENATDNNEQGYLAFYTTPSSGVITERGRFTSAGNFNVTSGNVVMSTSGKGIDFSAGGVANGVAYLDGSKLLASFSSSFKFDGTTLDLGAAGTNGRLTIKAPSAQRAVLCYNSAGTAYFYTDNDNAVSTGANGADSVLFINKITSNSRSVNAAGTLNASGADYAEYMTKAGSFAIAKGDVCGVDVDGKLTNVFANAVSFVVKSSDPSFVGGDTWGVGLEGDELEAARQQVDRVAFAGQVPVNITGAAPGQYIVPVDDGGAIKPSAVDEANMTLAMYMKSVGKVIAIEPDGRAKIIVKTA